MKTITTTSSISSMATEKKNCNDLEKEWNITCDCDECPKRRICLIASVIGIIIIGGVVLGITICTHKPRFIIRDATIYNFSVNSSPDLFNSTFQITIDCHNPNAILGFYYKNLNAYANYRDQQISLFTSIPHTYQGPKDSNIWSPLLIASNVPISPYNVYALTQDQASGNIPIVIKIMGQFRWKLVRTIIISSRPNHLHVTCPAFIPTHGSEIQGSVVAGTSIKFPLSVNCQVGW